MTHKKLTQKEINFVKKFFPDNGSRFCCEQLGISDRRLRTILEKFQIKINPQVYKKLISDAYIKNNRNKLESELEKLFNFKSDEICYFFGFFWADGSIRGSDKLISIGIQEEDGQEVKSAFLKAFDFKVEVRSRERYGIKNKNIMLFRKSSLFCFNRLTELEFDKKSKTSPFKILSLIPKEKHYLFWRGFFDGDGCAFKSKTCRSRGVSFAGSFDQNWYCLIKFLKKNKINPSIYRRKGKGGGSTICLRKLDDIKLFFNLIYPNGWDELGLKRKFDKLESIKPNIRIYERKFPKNELGFHFIYKTKKGFIFSIKIGERRYSKHSKNLEKCILYGNKILLENDMPLNIIANQLDALDKDC